MSTSFRSSAGSDGIVEMDGLVIGGASFPLKKGTTYHVDAVDGSDSNTGLTWSSPFLTMSKAFTTIGSGDTIIFVGKVREQLTTPVQVFDVTVIGGGNRPRHADAAPVPTGGESAATWTTPASGATTDPLCTVLQQGWRFVNILFAGPSDESCVELFRNGGAGNLERDASHAEFIGCRFASGQDGIVASGGLYGVLIQDCRFLAMTGHAVKGVVGAGIGNGEGAWQIFGNSINGCANGIDIAGQACQIKGNFFDDGGTPGTTTVLDVSSGANNFIVGNYFQTTSANFNTPDIVGNATDVWNNTNIDATFTSGGVSGLETGQPS